LKDCDIVQALAVSAAGTRDLKPLLDDPDPAIRISAAIFLIELIPDVVLPMLRAVDVKKDGFGPTRAARFELARYEEKHPEISQQSPARPAT
jgi:hypothetical protein